MKAVDIRTHSAEIGWEKQRDAFGVAEAQVEADIVVVDEPCWLLRCEIWNGLFGGFPSRDQAQPVDSVPEYVSRKTHGQVQEITATIYVQPKRGPRRRLFERDLHQLDPSASFSGTEARELAFPVELEPGDRVFVVARTSQRDRGAHTRATITVSRVDPHPKA